MNGVLVVVLVFLALMIGGVVGGWAIWPYAEKQGRSDGLKDRGRHRQDKTLLPAGLARLPLSRRIGLDRLADPTPLPGESWDIWPISGPAEYEPLTRADGEVAG